jgi:hypothetical protein
MHGRRSSWRPGWDFSEAILRRPIGRDGRCASSLVTTTGARAATVLQSPIRNIR